MASACTGEARVSRSRNVEHQHQLGSEPSIPTTIPDLLEESNTTNCCDASPQSQARGRHF